MSRGGIYEHIRLLDASGKAIELPFLEIDEELWDPAMTRLTLFIDPGRIKRGVRPLEEIGPALEEGKAYTLVIDRAAGGRGGERAGGGVSQAFSVGPPDRDPPDPAKWKVTPPTRRHRAAPLAVDVRRADGPRAGASASSTSTGEDGRRCEGTVDAGRRGAPLEVRPGAALAPRGATRSSCRRRWKTWRGTTSASRSRWSFSQVTNLRGVQVQRP